MKSKFRFVRRFYVYTHPISEDSEVGILQSITLILLRTCSSCLHLLYLFAGCMNVDRAQWFISHWINSNNITLQSLNSAEQWDDQRDTLREWTERQLRGKCCQQCSTWSDPWRSRYDKFKYARKSFTIARSEFKNKTRLLILTNF